MPHIHLVSRPAAGGIKTHIEGLMADLPVEGWQVTLHAPASLISSFSETVQSAETVPLEIPSRLSLRDFTTALKLSKRLHSGDIVHAHGVRAAWICLIAQRIRHFSLVVTLHNLPPSGLLGSLIINLFKLSSAHIICVSQAIAQRAQSNKTVVIPNGVDCTNSQIIRCDRAAPPRPVALCVARLSPEKGIDLLIEAARETPQIDYMIAGDGLLRDQLKGNAPSNVDFLGHRSDIRSLMSAAHCLVIPSRSEGQGIVALEAFVAGLPVIATSVGGLKENVIDNVTGHLVPPEDPTALAKKITQVVSTPESQTAITAQALAWVNTHGRRQTQSSKVAALYSKLVK